MLHKLSGPGASCYLGLADGGAKTEAVLANADGRAFARGARGPRISDEGCEFDMGRRALQAVALTEGHRAPGTLLSQRIFKRHECRDRDSLLERIAKFPDAVFPRTFPLVAEVAVSGGAIPREILTSAANSLASLVESITNEPDWRDAEFSIAKLGDVFDRSRFLDAAVETRRKEVRPPARSAPVEISPAEAAACLAVRSARAKGHVG